MSRVRFAAEILKSIKPKSILDIGCRDCELAEHFPNAEYHGADLFPGPRVSYVGDITTTAIKRSFDVIVACDILEHLDDPSALFDRLVPLADRHLLISLPNTYDLKSHWKFIKGDMGGKYRFTEETPIDRHRWLMSRREIVEFAERKAEKHDLDVDLFDLTYGLGSSRYAPFGRIISAVLPRSLSTETVFALFSRIAD